MGKFNPKASMQELKVREQQNKKRLKKVLKSKKLLEIIYSKSDHSLPVDATLLFGSHKGEKVSDLLVGFDTARYVLEYLARNKDLPQKVRKVVKTIIDNQDSFSGKDDGYSVGLNIQEFDEDDDIPW